MPKQFIGFINRRHDPEHTPDNTIPAIFLTGEIMLNDDDDIEIRKPPEVEPNDIVHEQADIVLDPVQGNPVLRFINGWTANRPNYNVQAVHGYSVYKVT